MGRWTGVAPATTCCRWAVKECTDTRFPPERFRSLSLADVNARIEQLKRAIGD